MGHIEWSFATNCFIFLRTLFDYKNVLQIVDLIYQVPKHPF